MMKKTLACFLAAGMLLAGQTALAGNVSPTALPTAADGAVLAAKAEDGETIKAVTPGGGVIEFAATDYAKSNDHFSAPGQDVMSKEDALSAALKAVMDKYGETPEALKRFSVHYGFVAEDSYFKAPYWQFDFGCDDPLDQYEVMVHVEDGQVIYIVGDGEGNG